MKSLISKLSNLELIIQLRNTLNYKPLKIFKFKILQFEQTSTSDAFIWRTDNGFTTKFKFSDILKLFFKIENSFVELHFYSKFNKLITIKKISDLDISNEIIIDKNTIGGLEDYGVFYAFHIINEKNTQKISVSNKCYTGFSKNKVFYNFVHGNVLAKTYNYKNKKLFEIIKTSFIKNQTYLIQKYFDLTEKNELFFSNPSNKSIIFNVNKKKFNLKKGCSKLIVIEDNFIKIKSNCYNLRPIAFSYKQKYFDVHHC
jgi:hypothetical protein